MVVLIVSGAAVAREPQERTSMLSGLHRGSRKPLHRPRLIGAAALSVATMAALLIGTAAPALAAGTDPLQSTVGASQTSVEADGTSTSTITITLLDASSVPVQGDTVTLTAGSGSSTVSAASGPSDVNGQVTFTVKDATVESVTYQAVDETTGVPIAQTATVAFIAGPADAATSTVEANSTWVEATGTDTSTVTVTLLDASSVPVHGDTVTLDQGGASSTISPASGTSDVNGQVTFTVKDATVQNVTYTATDTTAGVTVTQTVTVDFVVETADAGTSTVVATPTSVPADGTSTSTVTVTLMDASHVRVANDIVTLTPGGGSSTVSPASATTDVSGQVTFTVKDATAEDVTYTATDTTADVTLGQTVTVDFVAGPPDAGTSTVVATPTSVEADGTSTSTVTVTLLDPSSVPVQGDTVTLTPGGGSSTVSPASGTTDVSGQVTFTVKDATVQNVTYTATDTTAGVTITQTATVNFIAGTSGGGSAGTTPSAPTRLYGSDRFGTAIAISTSEFPTPASAGAVIVARADDYADAVVAVPLAAGTDAPLLLADGGSLTSATQAEIRRVLPVGGTVYIVGGTAAVPASVATTLTGLGFKVQRYFGADRYGTAVAVAAALGNPSTVLLAAGADFADALTAGPAAAHEKGVVLLTDGTTMPTGVAAYLSAHKGTAYAIGAAAAKADPNAIAIVGSDRYSTAAEVASMLFSSPDRVGIATGATFPDALCGGTADALAGSPLLLTLPAALPTATSSYLATNKGSIVATNVFGGDAAVPVGVLTAIDAALGR